MKRTCYLLSLDDSLLDVNDRIPPEVALWRAVITQQLMDAGSNSKLKYAKFRKAKAIAWLAGTSRDFHEVCTLADLDPDYVRRRARLALMRRCTWRKYNANSFTGRTKK